MHRLTLFLTVAFLFVFSSVLIPSSSRASELVPPPSAQVIITKEQRNQRQIAKATKLRAQQIGRLLKIFKDDPDAWNRNTSYNGAFFAPGMDFVLFCKITASNQARHRSVGQPATDPLLEGVSYGWESRYRKFFYERCLNAPRIAKSMLHDTPEVIDRKLFKVANDFYIKFQRVFMHAKPKSYDVVFYGPGWPKRPEPITLQIYPKEVSDTLRAYVIAVYSEYSDKPKLDWLFMPKIKISADRHRGEVKTDGKLWVPNNDEVNRKEFNGRKSKLSRYLALRVKDTGGAGLFTKIVAQYLHLLRNPEQYQIRPYEYYRKHLAK